MMLKEDLGEKDASFENLYGTNGDMGQGFDSDYLDAYIDQKHTNQTRTYFIFGQDLFKFLHNKYGGHVFKRFYIRKNNSYYTTAEVHLTQLRTMFLNASVLMSGQHNEALYKKFWTQVSDNASLKDVKKRLVDHLRCAGLNIGMNEVRLWMLQEDSMNPDRTNIPKVCEAVAAAAQPNSQAV